MSMIEDRLRAATQAAADTIPAHSAPPLRLPEPTRRAARGASRSHGRRLTVRLAAPLAAAAAVIAIIAVAVNLPSGNQTPRPPVSVPASKLLQAVPRYYLGIDLNESTGSTVAVVRDTLTGATVATARPPRSYSFSTVTGAADDRTFVVKGVQNPRGHGITGGALFRAHFDPANHTLTITPLHIRLTQTEAVNSPIALSANGAELAIGVSYPAEIQVYSLTNHGLRTWTAPGNLVSVQGLAGGPSGELAFWYFGTGVGPASIRILNTNASSGNLLTASRLAVGNDLPTGRTYDTGDAFAMTGNGSTITVVISTSRDELPFGGAGKIGEFSAVTGFEVRPFTPLARDDVGAVLWFSPSGTVLVALAPRNPGPGGRQNTDALGILSGRQFVPIPRAPDSFAGIAF